METEQYREWIAISQYEALTPSEAAELEAHLAAHPESRKFQEEVRAIKRGLDAWKPVEAPLSADEILAQLQPFPSVVQSLPRPRAAATWWKRGLAAAASFGLVALVWTQGIAIELGGQRVLAFNAPAAASLEVQRAQINQLVAQEVEKQVQPQFKQLVTEVSDVITNFQTNNNKALADNREVVERLFNKLGERAPIYTNMPSFDGGRIHVENVSYDGLK